MSKFTVEQEQLVASLQPMSRLEMFQYLVTNFQDKGNLLKNLAKQTAVIVGEMTDSEYESYHFELEE